MRLRRSDLLVPGVLGAVGAIEIVAAGYDPTWLGLASYVLAAGVLCAARFAPLAIPLLVTAIYALTPPLGFDVSEPASWVVLISFACFCPGLYAQRRLAGLASVLGALAITYATLEWQTEFEPSLLFGTIISVGAWALGVALRKALDENRRTGAIAERIRVERALAGERAVTSERNRIAGELHDVLAHSLGAMVVQSSVGRDLVRRDPKGAARALGEVARAGREALSETGRLLRLLRDDRDELGLRGLDAAEQQRDPAPAGGIPVQYALIPLLFGVVATVEMVSHDYGPFWASIGSYWLVVGLLCLRRRFPAVMPIGVVTIAMAARLAGAEPNDAASWLLPLPLACFAAGRHVPRLGVGVSSVVVAIALFALDAVRRGDVSADAVFLLVFTIGPLAVGVALRMTLERTRSLAAEAERTRLEHELDAERAVAAERKRIARELHDVLASSLSVMVVQAQLAQDLVAGNPDRAATAILEVERSGRTALGETGRLLRLIRGDVGTHPQHGVADIPTLAEEFERAGLGVDVELDGVAPLPIGVDLSTYRIVQEALTNALKHAPGSPVRVRLARRETEVAIEIRNGPAVLPATARVPSGHGLVGLRERVALFGGTLDARPTVDGGFVVAASIPVEEAA